MNFQLQGRSQSLFVGRMLICREDTLSNHNLKTLEQFARKMQQQLEPVADNQEVQRHFLLLLALKVAILSPAISLPRPASFLYLTIHDTYEER